MLIFAGTFVPRDRSKVIIDMMTATSTPFVWTNGQCERNRSPPLVLDKSQASNNLVCCDNVCIFEPNNQGNAFTRQDKQTVVQCTVLVVYINCCTVYIH